MAFAKDFFDLQLSFAERARDLTGASLEDALLDYTNFYVRFGFGRDFDALHEGWQGYLAGLRVADESRDWSYRQSLRASEAMTAPAVVATFGCFSYALPDGKHVRLHFRSADADGASPLSAERTERRRAELAALFAHMKPAVDPDTAVVGASWLYNLRAYRRLFPPCYGASAAPIPGGFRSMALWGQLLDRWGRVRKQMAESFLAALTRTTRVEELQGCFPFQALRVSAPLRRFHDFYGV